MRLSLLVIYCPEPTLPRAARFYGAVLDAEPVRERHGDNGPQHWSVTSPDAGLVIEVYPSGQRPHTSTRLEFRGDAEAAVTRLQDTAFALPERTRDGQGWWCHDPIGNTVVLLRTE
ncbi:hypothetical protein [Mycobacterium sp. D16Q16]|uniref:VOC family protein n=1 Tax=Mycobacterium sp. D16Q16 TaxID=1855659 RepID=UPI000993EE34|nr:hypothetical protein [Mycobacterium sp. D16Q16]